MIVSQESISKWPKVFLVASRYDWTCPYCGKPNHEPEIYNEVICRRCNGTYTVDDNVEHSFH